MMTIFNWEEMDAVEGMTICEEQMLKNLDSNKVIIWGASTLGKRILNFLDERPAEIIIWDTNKAGQIFVGFEIKKPVLTNPDLDIMKNAYIILAFCQEHYYLKTTQTLEKLGYKNIINGSSFLKKVIINRFKLDYHEYKDKNTDENFMIDHETTRFHTDHVYSDAGTNFNDLNLIQDLWAAKKIFNNAPSLHVDIGSRVDGFITHLLSFDMKTVLIDIRELNTYNIENLTYIKDDAMLLKNIADDSVESLSAICSLEHFGMGLYGDPICPDAHIKCFYSMQRVLKKGGDIYFSVPVSKFCKLCFNSHRIYSPEYILSLFDITVETNVTETHGGSYGKWQLVEFSLASNEGLIKNADINNVDEKYYFGLFHFRKK